MAQICERCTKRNDKRYSRGPFEGMTMELDYCKHCSQDLCDTCMAVKGDCMENGNHEVEHEE